MTTQHVDGSGGNGAKLGGGAIASIAGLAGLVIFMLQNTAQTKLKFLIWSFEWPLWLLIIVSALFGALLWFGLGVMRRRARRKARRADR